MSWFENNVKQPHGDDHFNDFRESMFPVHDAYLGSNNLAKGIPAFIFYSISGMEMGMTRLSWKRDRENLLYSKSGRAAC
jgi:hypothetical protein